MLLNPVMYLVMLSAVSMLYLSQKYTSTRLIKTTVPLLGLQFIHITLYHFFFKYIF